MSYIAQFEAELGKKLRGAEDSAAIVRWVSGKILESYRNGVIAGRKGESRRKALPSQAQ
jgi:hypothetical protein